jgi:hypothetical protein
MLEDKSDINRNSIGIKQFVIDDMLNNSKILMIAKHSPGKSYMIKNIVNHYQKFKMKGAIISPTVQMKIFYNNFVQDAYIHYKYDEKIIEKILQRQILMINKAYERKKLGKETNTKVFIVMDDCFERNEMWQKDPMISALLFDGRSYNVSYLLATQYPMNIKPAFRFNFDYIFLFADESIANQKWIYEYHCGFLPNFETFRNIFLQIMYYNTSTAYNKNE